MQWLRQFQIEPVNFLSASITNEYPRTIRHTTAPKSKWPRIAIDSIQNENTLGMTLAYFDAADRFFIGY
jgi:hypothetical protein